MAHDTNIRHFPSTVIPEQTLSVERQTITPITSRPPGGFFVAKPEKTMKQTETATAATRDTVRTDPGQEPSVDWVLAEKYEELTGVTPMAVHNRRRAGVWLDGKHCAVVARRLYVNIKEADKWIQSQISPRRLA
ncbi:UNVERIFIED_CONTAM: excisionase family protein [Comamonas sp. A-3]|uniref:hypothetical protein n=1 Tax=Comamonas sp. TaxID=34028 RepID=UPI0025BD7B76|nr:hypothetical protein [Comamonas sp.]